MKASLHSVLMLVATVAGSCSLFAQEWLAMPPQARNKIDPLLQQVLSLQEAPGTRYARSFETYSAGARLSASAGDVVGVLIQSRNDIREYVRSLGGVVGSRHGDVWTALLPINSLGRVADQATVNYIEASRWLYSSLDLSRAKTGADVLQAFPDSTRRLTGKGVILGFTDTGINTSHPNFRTADGRTRILFVWDQFAIGFGSPPAGFSYGAEEDSAAINAGRWSMSDYGEHGTHVSGIAGGNGLPSNQYIGMAPEADFIMVANYGDDLWNHGLTTVGTLDGYDYIRTKSQALGKPFVINTSQGTNLGPHDGTTLFERAINADVAAGNILCLAAGNEAISSRHASATVTTSSPQEVQTSFSGDASYSVPMDIWYAKNDRLILRIKQSTDAGYVWSCPPVDSTITCTLGATMVTVTTKIGSPLNGDNEIYLTFQPTAYGTNTSFTLQFSTAPGNLLPDGGKVDAWWERNYPVSFTSHVDPSVTLGMPACADSAITVASYNNRASYGNVDDISSFSSRGPTRTGKMKPDIAGIGGMVMSSVDAGSYAMFSGTSMSSPHVAGAVALLLQQDRTLTSSQVRQKLIAAATADAFTGSVPNAIWGHGKLNVLKAAGYRGIPIISVARDTVRFASALIGWPNDDSVEIRNLGNEVLTIGAVTTSDPTITVSPSSFTVPPRDKVQLVIRVTPTSPGDFAGEVTIASDDSSHLVSRIVILGHNDFPPHITVSPDSLSFEVFAGDSSDAALTLGNTGTGDLRYEIAVDYSSLFAGRVAPATSSVGRPWNNGGVPRTSSSVHVAPSYAATTLLPLIVADPIGDATEVDVSEIRGVVSSGTMTLQIVTATPLVIANFGGYLGLDIDANPATGITLPSGLPAQDVGCEYFAMLFYLDTYGVELYDSVWNFVGRYTPMVDTAAKNFTFSIPLADMHTDGRTINLAAVFGTYSIPTDYVPDAGHGTVGQSWLSAIPAGGVVAPGGTFPVAVRVKSGDMEAGTTRASLKVLANDPMKRLTTVPVSLTIHGMPNLSAPDSIRFPRVFVGFPDTIEVPLLNNGTDLLAVAYVAVSDPQFSVVGPATFSIPKRTTYRMRLSFNPTSVGHVSASVSITSNDPTPPTAIVPITAVAAFPPVISVSPDSLAFMVHEADSAGAPLTIYNTGAGVLTWDANGSVSTGASLRMYSLTSAAVDGRNPDAQTTSAGRVSPGVLTGPYANLTGKRIGFITYDVYSIIPADLAGRGARVHVLTLPLSASSLDTLDVITIDDAVYAMSTADIACVRAWMRGGRGLLVQGDNSTSMPSLNALIDGTGVEEIAYPQFSDGILTDIAPHAITQGVDTVVSLAYGSYCATSTQAFVLVRDISAQPHVVLSDFRGGRVMVACNEIAGDFNMDSFGDTRVLVNRAFDWLAGGNSLLKIEPSSGTIQPGTSQIVAVEAVAGKLSPGTYRSDIALVNDDPLHNPMMVPVSVRIVGKPVIGVRPDTLDCGSVFIGFPSVDTLSVDNHGSEVLHVGDVTVSDTSFHPDKTSFSVPPAGSVAILFRFTRPLAGPFQAMASIASNDSAALVVTVPLLGVAVQPPRVSFSPDSLDVSAQQRDSVAAMLTLRNAGPGVLQWAISQESVGLAGTNAGNPSSRSESEQAILQQVQQQGNNRGAATVSPYAAGALMNLSGSRKVLLWTLYADRNPGGEVENTMNAIRQFSPDVSFDTTMTTSPADLALRLGQADVFVVPEQENANDLSALGGSCASVLRSFVQGGRTMVVLDYQPTGSTTLLNGTGLLTINVILTYPSLLAVVHDPASPLVAGVATLFTAMNGANYHSSPDGRKIVRDLNTGNNVVTVRNVGLGRVIYVGMDFFSYDDDMARLLSNAVSSTSAPFSVTSLPRSGVIAPGDSQSVAVTLHILDVDEGTYPYSLMIASNDPRNPVLMVPMAVTVMAAPRSVSDPGVRVPKVFALNQNYPNPFNPSTTITYDVPRRSRVQVTVHNILGELITVLVNEDRPAGSYAVRWVGGTGPGAASGVYFVTLRAGDYRKTVKMMLVK